MIHRQSSAYARNAEELRELIRKFPEENPSVFLSDESFAAACYDKKNLRELKREFNGDADTDACEKWQLSASEWREQIEMAMIAIQATLRNAGQAG